MQRVREVAAVVSRFYRGLGGISQVQHPALQRGSNQCCFRAGTYPSGSVYAKHQLMAHVDWFRNYDVQHGEVQFALLRRP